MTWDGSRIWRTFVGKSRVPRKTKIVTDGDLPIERPVIEPLELEMIHRINLVAEAFESTD